MEVLGTSPEIYPDGSLATALVSSQVAADEVVGTM